MHQDVPAAPAVTPNATAATSGPVTVDDETHQLALQLLHAVTAVVLHKLRINQTTAIRRAGSSCGRFCATSFSFSSNERALPDPSAQRR